MDRTLSSPASKRSDANPPSLAVQSGGRTTISPPAKVKAASEPFGILSSGMDSLSLALQACWGSSSFLEELQQLKDKALIADAPVALVLITEDAGHAFSCSIFPHGANGYAYLIKCVEFSLKIGNWLDLKSRPNVLMDISSEALWRLGVIKAVELASSVLRRKGALISNVKPSRIDLCVDCLLPEKDFSPELLQLAVTRSARRNPFFSHHIMTGIQFGSGHVVGRLYDKPLEITQRSNKEWMYPVWGLEKVPMGMRVIRVEFQTRREALRQLKLNEFDDMVGLLDNLWAYCTRTWLKFQDNPGKHHTQRKTLPWWELIQNGFLGAQEARPLIRNKAVSEDLRQLACQAFGNITSMLALLEDQNKADSLPADNRERVSHLVDTVIIGNKTPEQITECVSLKRAKYARIKTKAEWAEEERKRLGFTHYDGGACHECSE